MYAVFKEDHPSSDQVTLAEFKELFKVRLGDGDNVDALFQSFDRSVWRCLCSCGDGVLNGREKRGMLLGCFWGRAAFATRNSIGPALAV